MQEQGNRLMAKYTGQTYEQIVQDFSRDRYFTAEEAKTYGLVDELLEPHMKAPVQVPPVGEEALTS